jgi:putative ABC transport system permease protein
VVADAGSAHNISTLVQRFARHFGSYDIIATSTDNNFGLVPIAHSQMDRIAALPGVAEEHAWSLAFVTWHGRRIFLIGNEPRTVTNGQWDYHGGDPAAAAASLDHDGMIVSTQLAQLDGVRLRDAVVLPTPAGPHAFHVTGIIEDIGWTEGVMVIGRQNFPALLGLPEVNQVYVKLAPGASAASVESGMQRILGKLAWVKTGDEFAGAINQANEAIEEPFVKMRNVAVLVALLAVFNTMLIAVLQRRREIGVLEAIGLSKAQLRAALLLEATLMVSVALGAAAVIGIVMQALGMAFLAGSTGLPLQFAIEPSALALAAASALVIVVGGSMYPAREAARVPVLEAIAYE